MRRITGSGALLLALLAIGRTVGAVELAPLEDRWERYMLDGVRGMYSPGARDLWPCSRRENPQGFVVLAVISKECIAVQDLTETGFLGIGTGGGWSLKGGRLSKVETDVGTVELYVKVVLRYEPGIFDNHMDLGDGRVEFFLVFHDPATEKRSVIRKWTRGAERILQGVTGRLVHHPESREIEIRVDGLSNPIRESFDVAALGPAGAGQ